MFRKNVFVCGRLGASLLGPNVKFLYSPAALNIPNYETTRQRVKEQFKNLDDKFKAKMLEFSDPANSSTVFTEDLKHMIHLAEEGDLPLVRQMMTKFCQQNKDMRFGSYIFGPVVMRMFYFLNKPNEALAAFRDPAFSGFFDQLITYQTLMDLLLKNEHYDDVLAVFDLVKQQQNQVAKYPKNVVVLAFAACYKMNTPQAQQYSKKLWSELNSVGHYPMRRAATFAAALAINQNEPSVALEILTTVKKQSYVTVRNLKVSALADLGRPDDALPLLRAVLEFRDSADGRGHTFGREALTKMEASVKKLNNSEVSAEFEAIAKRLETWKLVSDLPLDTQLCSEIEPVVTTKRGDWGDSSGHPPQQRWSNNSRSGDFSGNRPPRHRPGVLNMT